MISIINGVVLDFPLHYAPGDPRDEIATTILTDLYAQRLRSRAIYWLNKNPAARQEDLQSEVARVAESFVFDDEPGPDLIEEEAILIASELISAKLAADGLPPPKSLREHAEQLADDPTLRAQARARVLARTGVARELLSAAK